MIPRSHFCSWLQAAGESVGGFISLTVKNQHPSEIRTGGRPGSRAFPRGAWWKEDSLLQLLQFILRLLSTVISPFKKAEEARAVSVKGDLRWALWFPRTSGCGPWRAHPQGAFPGPSEHQLRPAVTPPSPRRGQCRPPCSAGPGSPRTETPGVTSAVVALLCSGGWAR